MQTDRLAFTKMQGCGNDYIYFNCFDCEIENPEALSVRLSDRHFGVGGDGIVLICRSQTADARMRMFNADGSEGKMCGNAVRCIGKYLYERKLVLKDVIALETLSGVKTLRLTVDAADVVTAVQVDMGAPALDPADIPVLLPGERAVAVPVEIAGQSWEITCVSMGNPHCVVFVPEVASLDLEKLGPPFERHPLFPERINTEFVRAIDAQTLEARVWERGSGETLACGTGACASVVAATLRGFCELDTDVTVRLRGGDLVIRYTGETVLMTGPAEVSFEGEVRA